jgi:hypothetical protein
MAVTGAPAQLAEHRAGLDRGQLVLVAEQDQARRRRQGGEHRGHHFQVDHRRFVDHQHVERQRIAGMMAKAAVSGRLPSRRCKVLTATGIAARTASPCARSASGRRTTALAIDSLRRAAALPVGAARRMRKARAACPEDWRSLPAPAPAPAAAPAGDHGRRLAGARAAGDDTEAAARSKCAGYFLPVG